MKTRAACPHCKSRLSRWYVLLTVPFAKYSCGQCGKRFRAESLSVWFAGLGGAVVALIPLGLASAGVVSWIVPAAAVALVVLAMTVLFPYLAMFVSAEEGTTESVENRLAALEGFRRTATCVMVTATLVAMLLAGGVAGIFIGRMDRDSGSLRTVRTRFLEVTDPHGKSVFTLWGGDEDGGVLTMENSKGTIVMSIVPDEGGAHLRLRLGNGKTAAMISSGPEACSVSLYDSAETPRVRLSAERSEGRVAILDHRGKTVVSVGESGGAGGGMIDVSNGEGVRVATVQANKRNEGLIGVYDTQGKVKKSLSASD